jgi:DNA polymerase-1
LGELFVSAAPAVWTARYETVATEAGLRELVATLRRQKRIAVDTETTSAHARLAQVVGCSFAWQPGHAVYLPLRAPQGDPCLDASRVLEALRPVLEDPAIEKIGQNIKYDMIVLRGAGITLRGARFDTMVADYLLAPGERSHSVDDLAKRYLNHDTIRIRELIGTGRNQRRMDEVPVSLVTPYAGQDADIPLRLAKILGDRLRDDGLDSLFDQLEMPLVEVLADMEFCGVRVDVSLLGKLSRQYGERMAELEAEIYELAGHPFNIDSPKQLGKVLFAELGLPQIRRTKTGSSTDVEVLEELAPRHPLPAKIIEYRQQAKLKGTYVDALPSLVVPGTGRVHTSFKQDVAATGRLSSTDPNLQNIPVRTRDGREIRAAFVPGDPHWQLLCADYSQIELRVLAHCSQDAALLQAFATDQDIHAQVAGQVYGIAPEAVTQDMRRAAKAINFGIIYGQSAFGLAKSLGIEKGEAAQFIDAYFAKYPGVDAFMNRILAECREKGYVTTTLGRRRGIQGVRDVAEREKNRQRTMPERIAVNTVIQGSAADLIKMAMIRVHRRLGQESLRAQLLLQIHDELVLEVPPDEMDRVSRLVSDEMSGVGDLSVRLKVDLKAGANWADCEPWH